MDYTNADDDNVPSHAYTLPVDVQAIFSKSLGGFNHVNLVNSNLGSYQRQPLPGPNLSSNHDSAPFFSDDVEDLLGGPVPCLESTSSLTQGFNLQFPLAAAMDSGDHMLEGNIDLDLTQLQAPIPEETPLRCNEPGCDDQRFYSNMSTLRKHQGKHTRPYSCKQSSCNYRRFGDKAGLTRHLREVHGKEVHYCPFISCNRNSRGFPRKYNLIQHQKRCHGDQSTHSQRTASRSSSLVLPQDEDDITELGLPPNRETDGLSGTEIDYTGEELSSKVENKIMKRLGDLKILRAEMTRELDRDIAMLEGALGLIEEDSS